MRRRQGGRGQGGDGWPIGEDGGDGRRSGAVLNSVTNPHSSHQGFQAPTQNYGETIPNHLVSSSIRPTQLGSCVEDLLKGFEERLMGGLSEVCLTVKKMDKRLGRMEKSHEILKKRVKKMKVEKRLTSIEEYQHRLLRRTKKQKILEERLDGIEKEMKRKKNENSDRFEYQTMDFDWNMGRFDKAEKEAQKKDKGSEEEAQKKDKGSEEEADETEKEDGKNEKDDDENEIEEDKTIEVEEARVDEKNTEVEETLVDAEAGEGTEVEEEARVDAEEDTEVEE
nr:PREDICTED: RNA polymerase-associated protein CTR9 homolog [Raphanus sativus]XP_018475506.1 PREDICTED: RNA polymerase-associated protein CTR9 homolog [Raphanus sativus]